MQNYESMLLQNTKTSSYNSPLVKTDPYVPVKTRELKYIMAVRKESEIIITDALRNYGYLIDRGHWFRLCYLAQQMREFYDCVGNPRNKLIADVLILNSHLYDPLYRETDMIIRSKG
jgi:hypothetical protein